MERRHETRSDIWLPVEVESLAEGMAVVRNASTGGALLVTASKLEVGARVTIVLKTPDEDQRYEASGCVVRVEPNQDDPNGLWPFRLAIAFDEENPELESLLDMPELLDH